MNLKPWLTVGLLASALTALLHASAQTSIPITAWPPNITPGQQWQVVMAKQDKGQVFTDKWQVTLTGLSQKGNPTGTATNLETNKKATAFLYYSKEEDTVWLDMTLTAPTFMSCKFAKGSIKDGLLGGKWLFFKKDQDIGSALGGCSAALLDNNAAAAPAVTQNSQLAWPLRPQPKQRYTFQFPRIGQVMVYLTGTDKAGAIGTARFSDGTNLDAYFYYDDQNKTTWLDLVDNQSMLYCAIEATGMNGNSLQGDAFYRKERQNTQQKAESLGTCSGQLN